MANQNQLSNKVVTGKTRLSYAFLFTPKPQKTGDPKFSTAVLVPKSDKATLARIKAAIDAVKKDPKSEKIWGKAFNAEMKSPLRDGDLKSDTNPEYAGHYFFNCSATRKPGIVDKDLNPIIDPDEVYSGCYARVSVSFFAYNQGGGIGIGAWLNNVQKRADGERLSGGASAEEDFADGLESSDDDFLS
jgi:hypothetical protein